MSRHTKKRRTFVRRFLPIRITPFRKGVADRRLQQRLEGIITECAEKVNFRAVPPPCRDGGHFFAPRAGCGRGTCYFTKNVIICYIRNRIDCPEKGETT